MSKEIDNAIEGLEYDTNGLWHWTLKVKDKETQAHFRKFIEHYENILPTIQKELTKLERIEEVIDKGGTITTNYNVIQKIKSILEEE